MATWGVPRPIRPEARRYRSDRLQSPVQQSQANSHWFNRLLNKIDYFASFMQIAPRPSQSVRLTRKVGLERAE